VRETDGPGFLSKSPWDSVILWKLSVAVELVISSQDTLQCMQTNTGNYSVANCSSLIYNVFFTQTGAGITSAERATRLWAERSRDRGLILDRNERCFSFPQHPDKFWVPSSSCSESTRAFFNTWSRLIINYSVLPEPSERTGLRSCINPHTCPELLG